MYVNGIQRLRGQLLGGAIGRAIVEQADAWCAAQDEKDPARFLAGMIL